MEYHFLPGSSTRDVRDIARLTAYFLPLEETPQALSVPVNFRLIDPEGDLQRGPAIAYLRVIGPNIPPEIQDVAGNSVTHVAEGEPTVLVPAIRVSQLGGAFDDEFQPVRATVTGGRPGDRLGFLDGGFRLDGRTVRQGDLSVATLAGVGSRELDLRFVRLTSPRDVQRLLRHFTFSSNGDISRRAIDWTIRDEGGLLSDPVTMFVDVVN